jgi:GTP-binding protein Era
MQRSVDETLADVDAVLFVLDATAGGGPGDAFIAERVFGAGAPVVIALNKIDRLGPAQIADAIAAVAELGDFHALHPVSARTGDGVGALRDELAGLAVEGPPLYPRDAASGDPVRLRIAELVREQALRRLREEVPHAVAVVVDELTPGSRRRAADISATIFVDSESQRGIVVGRGGAMVRDIGTAARPLIEQALGTPVMLRLRVDVRKGWRDDDRLLDQLGP